MRIVQSDIKEGAVKKIFLVLLLFPFMIIARGDAADKTVLLKEKLLNDNKYMIVARGYSKPGITDTIQANGTAKEAALLNAQMIARERFIVGFDVIQNGRAKKYTLGKGYADVVYILSYPGLKKYLRK